MNKIFLIISLGISINILSQQSLTKDSFFLQQKNFPGNYKEIVGDPKGWKVIGRYDLYKEKVDLKLHPWDTLAAFTPFNDGKMFLKIRNNKIVGRGDRRGVTKIIYVDDSTLILEDKYTEKVHGKKKKSKTRTLYHK
jgi:hypothetical protein